MSLGRIAAADGLAGIARDLTAPASRVAIVHTVAVAGAVTVLAVTAGTALALAVERRPARSRLLPRLLVAAPLVIPEFVLGFAWSQAYGPAGLSDRLTGLTMPGLFGPAGIIAVLTVYGLPLAYLAVTAGLAARADPALERAARAAGASGWTTLRTVTLPLLRIPLLAAAALVFVTAAGSFAVPEVLGTPAGFATMSTLVYSELALSAAPAAFTALVVLALAMVVLVLLALGPLDLWLARLPRAARTQAPPAAARAEDRRRPRPHGRDLGLCRPRGRDPDAHADPHRADPRPGPGPGPGELDPGQLPGGLFRRGGRRPGPQHGARAGRRDRRAGDRRAGGGPGPRPLARAAGHRGHAVLRHPGLGARGGHHHLLRPLAGRLGADHRLAYVAKFWVFGHRPVQAALDRLPPGLTRAARLSGARPAAAARTVVLPPLTAAAVSAAALVFILAFHELTMSTILYGPGTETFAVVIMNTQDLGGVGATAALALVLTVPVVAVAALAAALARRTASSARDLLLSCRTDPWNPHPPPACCAPRTRSPAGPVRRLRAPGAGRPRPGRRAR